MFLIDDSGEFEAPLEAVWQYFESTADHRAAHHHRNNRLELLPGDSFLASWEQDFEGRSVAFTMRGTTVHPLGLAYEVLEGPFAGSRFLNYYTPKGGRTGVTLVGEFTSRTLPRDELEGKVLTFFGDEFAQDVTGLREFLRRL
ncbi:MAG: hypothetical protein ACHQ2Y_03600 [Candidatus Lutacidiplasmatales archaeon]